MAAEICPQVRVSRSLDMEFCWNVRLHPTSTSTSRPAAAQQRKRPRASKIITSNVQDRLCYLRCYKVLVYKEHATGIQNLSVHLRDQHGVAGEERKAIEEHC